MRLRNLAVLLALLLAAPLGFKCNLGEAILIMEPGKNEVISGCSADIGVLLNGAFVPGSLQATINFVPVPLAEGPPSAFLGSFGPAQPLQVGTNLLTVQAQRQSDGVVMTAASTFEFAPESSAKPITSAGDLMSGPLAHGRVGDYLIENCFARFIVQDVAQRDMYSVGSFGGNIIDLELVGNGGKDQYLESTPIVNIETVINYDELTILNDGTDGNAAEIRVCGPDDILDFVNPSSQVVSLGLPFPAGADDFDQAITGCTVYSLEPDDTFVKMETTLTNEDVVDIDVYNGDWLNPAGELRNLQLPNPGLGPGVTADLGSFGFFGVDDAAGTDYSFTSLGQNGVGSYVVISGVTFAFDSSAVLLTLLGFEPPEIVPAGGDFTFTRYLGVGDGSGSSSVDLAIEVQGSAFGTVKGCVTRGGVPAPGAKVTIGTLDAGELDSVLSSFVADANGCYQGNVPVPAAAGENYGMVAGMLGTPYFFNLPNPLVTQIELFPAGDVETVDFALPATGSLKVTATDQTGADLPARVTVVGCDPSPEPIRLGMGLPGFGTGTFGLLHDVDDRLPHGVVAVGYTGADGEVEMDVEPGSYQVYVTRGSEYSSFDSPVTISAGSQAVIAAQLGHVIDTDGFVSSDYHVHGVRSADSKISDRNRVLSYSAEGVDNLIMTDHHAHTDLDPEIAAEGLGGWLASTVGEEITSFDYGHFNAYPLTVDPTLPSGGSTDWAQAAPIGMDFPSLGAFNATPSEIFTLATTGAQSTVDTTVQINHIGSHFGPLQIDTALVPPSDDLDALERSQLRFDSSSTANLYHHFPALELWNGSDRGHQSEFLDERIGIWMNLLNQGLPTTAIADTDSHRLLSQRSAGARTWTAATPATDDPSTLDSGEVARMVDAGKAVGGQGVFVTARLVGTNSGDVADLSSAGKTDMTDPAGDVELEVHVQAPTWAPYDTIEIYANAATTVVDPAAPYAYSATPTLVLTPPAFAINTVNVFPAVAGAERLETNVTVPFPGLSEDTWFVVVVKGSDGATQPMFPVYADDIDPVSNPLYDAGTNACLAGGLADLTDGNLGESGVQALGFTNALFYQN